MIIQSQDQFSLCLWTEWAFSNLRSWNPVPKADYGFKNHFISRTQFDHFEKYVLFM
jgi:hypothetical protein